MATGTWAYDNGTATYTYTDTNDTTIKVRVQNVTGTDGLEVDEENRTVTVPETLLGKDTASPASITTVDVVGSEPESETSSANQFTFVLGEDVYRTADPVWEWKDDKSAVEYRKKVYTNYAVDQTNSQQIDYIADEFEVETQREVLVSLTGVNDELTNSEDLAAALVVGADKKITVNQAALNVTDISIVGGSSSEYTLAVGEIDNPTDERQWKVDPEKKSSTAIYQQVTKVEYGLAEDAKSITKLAEEDVTNGTPIDLATITGLAAGLTVADINDGGINVTGDSDEIFNLHLKVLGGAVNLKTLVHPDTDTDYKLSLDEDATKPQCSWTVSNKGVAAYNKVKPITYEVVDGTTITASGKVVTTTLATVSGVNSGLIGASADKLDEILVVKEKDGTTDPGAEGATITLGKEAFGMANLTYANANDAEYTFSANGINTEAGTPPVGYQWVINGTTATYINCESKAHYTEKDAEDKKGNKTTYFEYHAPVVATGAEAQITITGLKKGVTLQGDGSIAGISFEENSGEKTGKILISKELFDGTNIAITGSYTENNGSGTVTVKDYTLKFAEDAADLHETAAGATYKTSYVTKKGVATITQDVKAGYTLTANGKGILYSKAGGDAVIATVAGLAEELKTTDFKPETGVITLTEAQLPKNPKGATVTVTGTGGYTLATAVTTIEEKGPAWSVSGTTATYKSTAAPAEGEKGYSISADGKSLFYLAKAKDTVYATVSGINANLTYEELNGDSEASPAVEPVISFKPDDNGEKTIIVLQKRALTSANVSAAAGYSIEFGEGEDVYTSEDDVKDIKQDTWVVSGTKAELIECTPAYYLKKEDKKGTTYVYHKAVPVADEEAKVTLTGLKKNLMVNADGSIDGIKITPGATAEDPSTITLDSKVLGGGTVTVDGNYKLELYYNESDPDDEGNVQISEISYEWEAAKDKKGNTTGRTLTQTRTDGYDVSDDGKTITYSYNKKSTDGTVTAIATLTGIEETYLNTESNWTTKYTKETIKDDTKAISLKDDTISINSKDVLGAAPLTVGVKSAYKLAIGFTGGGEAATDNKWEVIEGKKGAISYAYKRVVTSEGGYALSADAKTISSMKANDSVTLFTINGLNEDLIVRDGENKIDAAATDAEIKKAVAVSEKDGTVTLGKKALGTSVISVAKGSTYKIQLDDDANIKTSAAEVSSNGWVVSGTTAKYQTYINGYYAHNAAKNTITYIPPSAGSGSGGATVELKGLKKGIAADQDGKIDGVVMNNKLITLKKSALGTTDVTWKGDGYNVELYDKADDERVPVSETTTEWAQNPKNAASWTLNQQVTAGFTLDIANKTVKYSAGTKPTALFTLNGLRSDLTDTEIAKEANVKVEGTTVYLGTGALGGTNVTLALPKNSTAYTIALDEEILQKEKTASDPQWIVEGTTAICYNKCNMPYYTVSGTTVTYHPAAITAGVSEAIIKITGLRKGTTLAAGDITVNNKTVTLSKTLLEGTSKVTVSEGYTLKLGEGVEASLAKTPVWAVTPAKKNNALADAKLTQEQTKGYICNGNTITAVPKDTTATLLTLSGINAKLIETAKTAADAVTDAGGYGTLAEAQEATRQAKYKEVLSYNTTTEKVTIGNSAFVENGTIAVGKGSTYTIAAENEAKVKATGEEWSINTKKNTATYTETKEIGNVTSADGKSIKNSTSETTTTLVTIAGFNPELTENDLNGGTSPISIDTENQAITLTNGALDPSRTVVIGTKGSPYTFVLDDEVTTEPTEKKDWVIKGGKKDSTAEYVLSETAYYKLGTDDKSVSYVPTAAKSGATAEIKITGLKKGAVVDNDNISLSGSGTVVTLKKSILGTGMITIDGDAKIKLYSSATDSENVPISELGNPKWNFNLKKGVASATLTQEKPAGYVLAADGKTVTYVAKPTTVTLATVSGINPKLLDDITDEAEQQEKLKTALKVDGNTITLNSDAIVLGTTTNVTLTRGKDINGTATTYELAMKADVAQGDEKVQWYVDGQTVKYIKCDDAHYELAGDNLSISYQQVKPVAGAEAQATISGLRKKFAATFKPTDGDIENDVKIEKVEGGTSQIVVSENLLSGSGKVTLDGDYTFEFKEEDVTKDATKFHKAADIEQVWTNTPNKKGVIGTLTQGRKAGYTISNDGKSIMNLAKPPKGGSLVMATVTGLVSLDHVLTTDKGNSDIKLGASDLRGDGGAVVVDGAGYTFQFDNTYKDGKTITAGNSGNIIVAYGDGLKINGGKGNDNITASGQEANINGGAGNDVITTDNDSSGATVAGGAGDDNITLNGKGNNTYVYNIGEGNDVINNFKTGDKIKLASYVGSTSGAVKLEKDGTDLVVTVAVGAKKKQGTITLVGAGDQTSVSFLDKNDKALDDISLASSGNAVEDPVVPTNELLYSSNYSQDAAQLDQVTPTSVNDYSVGDINTNQDATALTQNATIVTTSTNKK